VETFDVLVNRRWLHYAAADRGPGIQQLRNYSTLKVIRLLEYQLSSSSSSVLRPSSFVRQNPGRRAQRCCCSATARNVFFSVRSGAVVSQDHSAVSVSTVRLGVQFRRPKAASPPQELEVRAAGGRANF
jgi:hypothetical protein